MIDKGVRGAFFTPFQHCHNIHIFPFKDSFNGLFFISVGMLMNLRYLGENLLIILLAVGLVVNHRLFPEGSPRRMRW